MMQRRNRRGVGLFRAPFENGADCSLREFTCRVKSNSNGRNFASA